MINSNLLTPIFKRIISISAISLLLFSCSKGHKIHKNIEIVNLNIESSSFIDPAEFYCKKCKKNFIDSAINPYQNELPVLDLRGDFTGISKEQKVQLKCFFFSKDRTFKCDATAKIQGDYSSQFDKTNYSIQFFKPNTNYETKFKVELFDGCGKQSKYCLKADYLDNTHILNLCGAEIARSVSSCCPIIDEITNLPNKGNTEGFPVLLYENNAFYGLYNIVIPKDKWMFQMDDSSTVYQAIISTTPKYGKAANLFQAPANYDYTNGLEYEFCSTEDDPDIDDKWVVDSFNNIYNVISNESGIDFKNNIVKYVNIDRTLDYIICAEAFNGLDNIDNNIIYVTYDGIKWSPLMYDMDHCFGAHGEKLDTDLNIKENKLFDKILANFHDELLNRFDQLKKTTFDKSCIEKIFSDFMYAKSFAIHSSDYKKWSETEELTKDEYDNITNLLSANFLERLKYIEEHL